MSIAASAAWTTRAAISSASVAEVAQPSDAIVNTATPRTKPRLRPLRSASRSAGTSSAANTIE